MVSPAAVGIAFTAFIVWSLISSLLLIPGAFFDVGGVTFDVMVPNGPDSSLARVIERHGEGIDSICFSVDDMDHTQAELAKRGIEFSSLEEFRGNQVAFVSRKDACGISLEFIQPAKEGAPSDT